MCRPAVVRIARWTAALAAGLVLAVSLGGILLAQPAGPERERLTPRQLETPSFERPPEVHGGSRALSHVWADLTGPPGGELLWRLLPGQGAVLWIALIVALLVAFDFQRLRNPRNVELLALVAIGFLLFDVMRFFDLLEDPTYYRVMDWVFSGIVAISLVLFGVALVRLRRPHATPWRPNLPTGALMTLTLLLLGLNVLIGLARPPDDSSWYSNVGGQRLRERGTFPYGDPLFSGTPVATYSPVFYLAHIPFQKLLDPEPLNPAPYSRAEFDGGLPYYLAPVLAAQLTTVAFHLLAVAALFVAAWRQAGPEVAWGVTALYCGSAYVMGVGGTRDMIGGMTFISHIAPPAVSLLAFACLPRPLLAGTFLATAVATLFYPMFFIPAWLGYYWGNRMAVLHFIAGMALATVLIGVPVLTSSQAADGRGLIGTILHDTMGHQQDPAAYGSSPFGFWGLRGGIREALREPLVAGNYNTSPSFLMFAVFVVATFFLARGSTPAQLALLTGALAIGAQMWKIHATGVYVTWYYPFLLLGLFAGRRDPLTERPRPAPGELTGRSGAVERA
ncbi:MAG: hypothetical protein H0X67_01830 [Acidobacteria bacterium]|nr:hypothetical protein [Acidobacteriota bacterium]